MRTSLRKGTEMATKKTTTKKSATAKASNPAAKKVTTKKTPAKKAAMETEKYPVDGNVGEAHGKVQLWKDGPYWATTNIGAEKPENLGYLFWWGDVVGYKHQKNKWVTADGSASNFLFDREYVPTIYDDEFDDENGFGQGEDDSRLEEEGWITSDGILAPEHDAAHVQWGGEWRMPTDEELDDLVEKCDWTWTKVNGVAGYVVRGRGAFASDSIFLPAAGSGFTFQYTGAGMYGRYWSAVSGSADYDCNNAWYLDFDSKNRGNSNYYRYYGFSIRPVQEFTK